MSARMACVVAGGVGPGSAPSSRSATPASPAPRMQAVRDDAKSEPAEPEVPLVAMQATLPERHPPGNKHHITWLSPGGERVLVHVPPDALPLSIIEFLVPEALLMEVISGDCARDDARCGLGAPDSPDVPDPPHMRTVFARVVGSAARVATSPGPTSTRVSPADAFAEVPAWPRLALRHAGRPRTPRPPPPIKSPESLPRRPPPRRPFVERWTPRDGGRRPAHLDLLALLPHTLPIAAESLLMQVRLLDGAKESAEGATRCS